MEGDPFSPSSPPERGRARLRSQSFKRPFQSFKAILARKMNLNRSLSRDRSTSPPRFSSGVILHAHSVPTEPTLVPLYLVIHVDPNGAIIAPEESSKIGTVICSCAEQSQTNCVKHIIFSSKHVPQLNLGEHFVSSPFIVPEVTDSYRRVHKSFPLLFRLDQTFTVQFGQALGDQISFIILKNSIHAHLMQLEKSFLEDENVSHVYEQLFDILPQVQPFMQPSAPTLPLVEHAGDGDGGDGSDGVPDFDHRGHIPRSAREPAADDERVPVGRLIENRSSSSTDPSTGRRQSPKMFDSVGILFVANQSATLLDIPRISRVKLVENYVRSWVSSGFKALFIVRNFSSKQMEFFPLPKTPPVKPFSPSVSSSSLFAAIMNYSQVGLNEPPFASLQLTRKLSKWFRHTQEAVFEETLFSKPAHCLPASTRDAASSASDSENESVSVCSVRQNDQVQVQVRERPSLAPQGPSSLAVDVYTPPILTRHDCPELFTVFWSLKAYPRSSISEKGKTILENQRSVAPKYPVRMLEVVKHVNMPNLLADEFESYARVYQAIVNERRFSTVDSSRGTVVHLSIQNEASVLARLGKGKILDDLKKNAPVLREQKLDHLTEAELQSFFFQARTYLLDNSAPYWSFPDFFLNAKSLGSDIYNKVSELLWGYPTYKSTLRQLSFFIESSVRQILPVQESFTDSEERIIASHRSLLLAPVPSVDHTKISLQADAQELLLKSPYYKQNKGTITEEFKRHLIEMHRSNLIIKIISNTHYEKNLIQLLIANDNYKSLDVVPFPVLITNLENLILVDQKTESIEVNAAKSARASRPRSKTRSAAAAPRAKSPRSPPQPPRSPRPRPRNPSAGQEACDICLLYEFDPRWCRQQNHCRVAGHQPIANKSETRERQIRSGDFSCFVLRQQCNKCNPRVANVAAPPFQSWQGPPLPPTFPQLARPPPRPRSGSRPTDSTSWAPWHFPPPRPSILTRQSSKSPLRFPTTRGPR